MSEPKPKSFEISKWAVWEAYRRVKANKGGAGVDGQSIAEFEVDLKDNLYKLWNRLSSGRYFPPPVRAVRDTEEGRRLENVRGADRRGSDRPDGRALDTWSPSVEPVFHEDSYGYRPGRSAHRRVAGVPGAVLESATGFWIWTSEVFFDSVRGISFSRR